MDLVGDDRAQSIQIGAVLLFAVLIIAFSSYQAFVVPDQNREVEFSHNQEVQGQMQDLRNAIVSARGTGEDRSVSVQLGTRYPTRPIARNPGPPSGTLRTEGTTDESVDLTIDNAQASGETGDFWNETQSYNTGGIAYQPQYSVYTGPPETVYENTILYNSFRAGNVTMANQSVIDGNDISLVVVNGSLSRSSSGSTSVDVRPVSVSTQTVRLEDDETNSNPLTIIFASRRSADYWDFLETTEPNVVAVTSTGPTDGFYEVTVELDDTQTYNLQLTEVGIGTQVTDEDTAYLTDTDGDGTTLSQGETTELTLEVRDRLNNPPDNASETTVSAQVAGDGSLDSTSQTPNEDGQVTFEYTAPSSATGEQDIEFTYGSFDSTFAESTPQDVVMTVDVQSTGGSGGGGGAYSVDWIRPPFTQGISNESLSTRTNLRTTPVLVRTTDGSNPVAFVDIDYGTNDASVVRTNESGGETNVTGYNGTTANWQSDGYATLYASSGGASATTAYTYDRLLNESFEHPGEALVSNGWYYNDSNPNGGDAGVTDSTGSPAGDNLAFIEGDAGTGDRAIELNYSVDTSNYDALTLTYVLRENGTEDNPDTPDSGSSNWFTGENLYVQYRASDDSWVTVDNVSSQTDSGLPETFPRRTLIQGVDNASHANFEIRFVQRETTAQDRWELDAVDVIGLSSAEETGLNRAPEPAFRYSPESPGTGDTITFDANRSDDPDDSDITSYEWDWDNDGAYEGSGETDTNSYSSSGDQTVTLRVTDGRGATATTSQTVTVQSGSANTLSNPEDPGFAYEDVNQDGEYQSSTDIQLSKSDLTGTYSANSGNALIVPSSVGAFDSNADIDWSSDGMFVGVDIDDESSISLDAGAEQLTVDGTRLDSLGSITATGNTIDATGVTVDNYQNGNGNGQPVQFTATGGSVDASNVQIAATNDITLDGTGVTATGTLDNYQDGNGGGSVDVLAGSGTADIGTSTVRSLNDINVSGTDVSASSVTLNNYQNGNGNDKAIRLEANGGDVTATSSSTFDSSSDILVSGTNVDISSSTLDNDQNGNGNGNLDVTASGDLTATSTSFQSLSAVTLTGGTVDVSSAIINNYQNGNGNGRDIEIDATSGSLTGTSLDIDSNAQIDLIGDSMDISDADLNNFQSSNGNGDIRLETRTGDIIVERAILTTNQNNRAFGVDTSGDDLFVQDAEFYQGNTNGNNGELINENAVDVNGTPASGSVST